ncbi:MAG: YfhO family protein [Lachnospiraceae bacterium]|nr:YfhO family protein [Lachnospiraceae bacterium]
MKLKNSYKYALPILITALLLCIIYIIKGIYPFGINTIDYYDMAQQIAAFYYHTFDFLHGEKNLFYDPYTALSVNMAMSTSGCSHLSIFNLFFLFVKREEILNSLSIFLMLKMMVMSLFMYIYVHGRYKLSYVYEVIFSVGYAFCGYVMMLYMTIQWLDVAALFPLLMLFLHKLLKEGKSKGYILILSLMMIASYYQSFMILIYIVLMVGVALFCDRIFEKEHGEKFYDQYHLLKLFIATVLSLILSAFIVIPQIKQTLNSARFNNENGGGLLSTYIGIVKTAKPAYTSRWWALLGLSFAFAIIIYGLYTFRKEKKTVVSAMLALAVILSELIVEGVNLFWHFGSYVGYPIRNGYMIYFTVVVIACGFIEKLSSSLSSTTEQKKGYWVLCFGTLVFLMSVGFVYSNSEGLILRNVFHITSLTMLVTFVIYVIVLFTCKGYMPKYMAAIVASEIILFGFIMIGKPAYSSANTEDPEQEGDYISTCIQLDEAFSLNSVDYSDDNHNLLFSRVKNPDTTLNANYGLVLRRPVLSNWTHILSPMLQRDASKLGYSVQYTRLLDSGGTVFSDALLGINEVISAIPLDENLYELEKETKTVNITTGQEMTYYLYRCKYILPFGLIVDHIDYDFENGTLISIYNSIYQSISGNKENIAEKLDIGNIDVKGKKAIYYFSNQVDTDDYNTKIYVNGETVKVPSIKEIDNTLYPAHFNNNAVYLGTFEDEIVELNVDIKDTDRLGNKIETKIVPEVISVDLNMLSELTKSYEDNISKREAKEAVYKFDVKSASNGSYLLLPLSYDRGYTAKVNGISKEVIPVGGIFSAVPVLEGENSIVFGFTPDGMKMGVLISLVGLFMIAIYLYFDKKMNIFNTEMKWLNELYFGMFVAVMIFVYIVPYIFAVLSVINIV